MSYIDDVVNLKEIINNFLYFFFFSLVARNALLYFAYVYRYRETIELHIKSFSKTTQLRAKRTVSISSQENHVKDHTCGCLSLIFYSFVNLKPTLISFLSKISIILRLSIV